MELSSSENDFRYNCEQQYSSRILKVKISPKRDLICCATEDSELFLHRFEQLERVWKLERLEHFPNSSITEICWRPDGRAIAVAYKSDQGIFFKLITEEGPKDLKDEISLPHVVKSMVWQDSSHKESIEKDIFPKLTDINKFKIYEKINSLLESNLSILTITLEENIIMVYLYGAVPLLQFTLPQTNINLLTAQFSDNFKYIYGVYEEENTLKCVKCATNDGYSIQDNLHDLNHFSYCVLFIQLLVNYLELTLEEMKKQWTACIYGSWHNYRDELTIMFLWGIRTSELTQFLTPITDVKAFDEVTHKCIGVCTQIQHYSIQNFGEAVDVLFHTICKLNVLTAFDIVKPRHKQTDFSKIQFYVGQMALKNVELSELISVSLDKGSSFFLWLYAVLTRIHGDENFDVIEDAQGQSKTDKNKILDFIQSYIDPDRISQYFEPAALKIPSKTEENITNFQKLLQKYNASSRNIYDNSFTEDNGSLASLSLKTTLDYTRRLITKLCFRDEGGSFGLPRNKLSESIEIKSTVTFTKDAGPSANAKYSFILNPSFMSSYIVFFAITENNLTLSYETGGSMFSKSYPLLSQQIEELHDFEDGNIFALLKADNKHSISVIKLNEKVTIIEKQDLNSKFSSIVPSAERRACCLIERSNKKIVLYELVSEDDDD